MSIRPIVRYRVFIKYCVFSKNSRRFATSPSPEFGWCYWLYKKLPANRSDCTLALRWELWRSITAMLAMEGWVAVNWKNTFFPEHPVLLYPYMDFLNLGWSAISGQQQWTGSTIILTQCSRPVTSAVNRSQSQVGEKKKLCTPLHWINKWLGSDSIFFFLFHIVTRD